MFIVHTGTITDGTHAIDIQESDDNATFTSVASSELQGAEPSIGAADDNKMYVVGYKGTKRYIRAAVTASGTSSGGTYGASVLLANPRVAPVVHP
jgi:type 1 fimbria pilin